MTLSTLMADMAIEKGLNVLKVNYIYEYGRDDEERDGQAFVLGSLDGLPIRKIVKLDFTQAVTTSRVKASKFLDKVKNLFFFI